MTMNRPGSSRATQLVALAALATLSLTACGSDPTSEPAGAEPGSSAGASGLACPAGKLSAEGSSAQANPPSPKSSSTTTPNAVTKRRSNTARLAQVLASSRSTTASLTSPAPIQHSRPRRRTG